ncbi:conserved hypothetical protein, partial [Ixodes scapularis]
CRNTLYGPECSCKPGYRLMGDRQACADINECEELPSKCVHRCQNLPGSFRCVCPPGQSISEDGRTCQSAR